MNIKIILVDIYEPNDEFIDIVKPTQNGKQMIFRLGIIPKEMQKSIASCTNKQQEFAKLDQFSKGTFDMLVNEYNLKNGKN